MICYLHGMRAHAIRPSLFFWVVLVLTTPLTFFVAPIALLVSMRQWPRSVDGDHLVLRDGTRIPWSANTNMMKYPGGRYELIFGATTVQLPTRMIAGGKQIADEIAQHLGMRWE